MTAILDTAPPERQHITFWERWMMSWVHLVDGFCGVITLGTYDPWLRVKASIWWLGNKLERGERS